MMMENQKKTESEKKAEERRDTILGCLTMLVLAVLIIFGIRGCLGGGGQQEAQVQVKKPEPRPIGYTISAQGEATPVMAADLAPASVDELVTADVTIDKSYLALGKQQYRVIIRVTNNDRWREFDGKVVLLMEIPGTTVDMPVGVEVPPMSTVLTDHWASPDSGEVGGYRIEGNFKLVWPELQEDVPPFEVVAFSPGIRFTRTSIVTTAKGQDLKKVVDVFREVYDATYDSSKEGLNGFELYFYPPELREAAEAKEFSKAKASYGCNFRTGYSSFTGDEDWVPKERRVIGYKYDAQTGKEVPIYEEDQ